MKRITFVSPNSEQRRKRKQKTRRRVANRWKRLCVAWAAEAALAKLPVSQTSCKSSPLALRNKSRRKRRSIRFVAPRTQI